MLVRWISCLWRINVFEKEATKTNMNGDTGWQGVMQNCTRLNVVPKKIYPAGTSLLRCYNVHKKVFRLCFEVKLHSLKITNLVTFDKFKKGVARLQLSVLDIFILGSKGLMRRKLGCLYCSHLAWIIAMMYPWCSELNFVIKTLQSLNIVVIMNHNHFRY